MPGSVPNTGLSSGEQTGPEQLPIRQRTNPEGERCLSDMEPHTHDPVNSPPTPTTPKCSGLKPPFYFAHSFAGQASGKGLVARSFLRGLSWGYCRMLAGWGAASEVQRREHPPSCHPCGGSPAGGLDWGTPTWSFLEGGLRIVRILLPSWPSVTHHWKSENLTPA